MPVSATKLLKQGREEKADQHEKDENYLLHCEKTYLRLAKKRNYCQINCTENNRIKTIQEIHNEVLNAVVEYINKN